ncbi:MAG TPA: hypothetical protein VIW94_00395 [Acidimicrobiia bacterium]
MTWFFLGCGILVAGFCSHLALVFAEDRGWIFYRHRPRIQFLGFFEELVEPRVEYVVEEQLFQRVKADHAESGQGEDLHSSSPSLQYD